MKRIFLLLLAALLSLSFLSCAAPKEGSDPAPTGAGSSETEAAGDTFIVRDRQCTFADMLTSPLIDTGDTLYITFGGSTKKIWFSDKTDKEWLPLCFKPDCFHRGPDCYAQLEGSNSLKIWPYGEHIYYVVQNPNASPALWRMKLDGSDHEKLLVFKCSEDTEIYDEYTWDFVFHNKYVYAWFRGSTPELREAKKDSDTLIFLVDLSLEKPVSELTSLRWETGLPVCGRGDTVYCFNTPNNNSITKVDIKTKSEEKLCELPFYPYSGLVLKDGRLYAADSFKTHRFISVDVETGDITPICSLERNVRFIMSDDYLVGSGKIMANLNDTDGIPGKEGTLILDYEGNLIQHIPYEKYGSNIVVYLSSGNLVFGYDGNDSTLDNNSILLQWYLDLSELGSEDMTWHKWAPEE